MLQQRGTVDKTEEIMLKHPVTGQPRTNAELIRLKLGRKPEDANILEGPLDYLDDAFKDLDNYCQGVMCNYKALKKFITEGYYIYFNGHGNLSSRGRIIALFLYINSEFIQTTAIFYLCQASQLEFFIIQ